MKKVLVFGISGKIGGTETVFDSFYNKLSAKGYHFDFVAREDKIAFQEKYIKNGSSIFVVPNFMLHPIKYKRAIRGIIRDGRYDIVHVNMLSAANPLPVTIAKKEKIPCVIAHSHNNDTCGALRKILHLFGKPKMKKEGIIRIACSSAAGKYIFGNSDFKVINNPFLPSKFKYSSTKREEIRNKYSVPRDSILLGSVGRLSDQKNPLFLLDVLNRLINKTNIDYRLIYIGDGSLRKKIEQKAAKLGVVDRIIYAGSVSDVEKYYSAIDVFVMPSKFEGLGMVALEAQAAGLPCVFSVNVPEEIDITNNVHLRLDAKEWADYIEQINIDRVPISASAFNKYDLERNAGLLASSYEEVSMNEKIDFVVMWVDPNDPEWQKEKAKYSPASNTDSSARRYRDWDNMQYWFRCVEKNAPWVNSIFFVTWGHVPKWLNVNNPKIKIVKHDEFIPKEYLPTFSANPIELNIHRIKGLSERFVFFNDDFFLVNKTSPTDFFKKGLPRDSACMYANIPSGDVVDSLFNNDMAVINRRFSMRSVLRRHPLKWMNIKNGKYLYNNITMLAYGGFPGIHFSHLPASFCKKTYNELWETEYEILDKTCRNRFRSTEDVNQWLIKYWQICKGEFSPRNVKWGKYYEYDMGDRALREIILGKKYKAACLNDTVLDEYFEQAKRMTNELFAERYPNKSSFER